MDRRMNFTQLLPLGTQFVPDDPSKLCWTREGKIYMGQGGQIRGADPETFRFYLGGFAVDARNCYCVGTRLTKADPGTFHALNFAYYKDSDHVWTIFGEIKKADAGSFTVADDGAIESRGGGWSAFGFGKDEKGVYYIGIYGYMGWLPGVAPDSFVSCQDGYFGFDQTHVYCGNKKVALAKPESWVRIGGVYSRDADRVYYLNHLIKDADAESFQVVPEPGTDAQLARDKSRFYLKGTVIESSEFEAESSKHAT